MERLACFAEQRMDRVALDEALERRRQVISSELYKLQLQPAAVRAPQYQKPPPPPTQQQQQQQRQQQQQQQQQLPASQLLALYGSSRVQAYLQSTSDNPVRQKVELTGHVARLRKLAHSGSASRLGESSAAPLYSLAALEAQKEDTVALEQALDQRRRDTVAQIFGINHRQLRLLSIVRPVKHIARLVSSEESDWDMVPSRRSPEWRDPYPHLSAQAASYAVKSAARPLARPQSAPSLPQRVGVGNRRAANGSSGGASGRASGGDSDAGSRAASPVRSASPTCSVNSTGTGVNSTCAGGGGYGRAARPGSAAGTRPPPPRAIRPGSAPAPPRSTMSLHRTSPGLSAGLSTGLSTAVSAAADVRWRAAPTIPAGGGAWRPNPVAVEAQVWRAESAVLGASPEPYATTEAPGTAPGPPVLLPPAVESAWAVAALAAAEEEAAAKEAAAEAEAEAEAEAAAAATSLVHRPVSSVSSIEHRSVSSASSQRFAPPEDAPETALDSELSLTELMTSAITSPPARSPRAQHGAAYEAAAQEAALATALAAAAEHPAFAWSMGAVSGGGVPGSDAMESAAGIVSAVVSAGGAGGGYDCGGGGGSGAVLGGSGAAEQEPNYGGAQHGAYLHDVAQHGATLQEPNYGAEAGFDAVGMHWGVPNTALPRAETPSDEIGEIESGRVRAIASEPPSVSPGRRDWLRRKVRRAVWEAVEPIDCH
jgi:hypothetical protein